jgi:hypothetical protein
MKDESTAGPSHYTWADYITISLLRPFYLATFLSSDRLPSVKRHRLGARLVCVSHLFRICFASV